MKTVVIGIGNLLRCDDGAGIHLVNFLENKHPGLDVFELTMGSVDIIEILLGYERAYIVDAVKTGADPGTIFRINVSKGEEPPIIHSSHGVDVFSSLRLGEELYSDELPGEIIVFGIEAKDLLSFNMECTEPVRNAIKKIASTILKSVE